MAVHLVALNLNFVSSLLSMQTVCLCLLADAKRLIHSFAIHRHLQRVLRRVVGHDKVGGERARGPQHLAEAVSFARQLREGHLGASDNALFRLAGSGLRVDRDFYGGGRGGGVELENDGRPVRAAAGRGSLGAAAVRLAGIAAG